MRTYFVAFLVIGVCLTIVAVSGSALKTASTAPRQKPSESPFRLFNPDTMAKPAGAYSQVAEIRGGRLIYIAGQTALDRSGNLIGKGDFEAQVQQAFKNLNAAIEAAGGSFDNIVKLSYYCTEEVDASDFRVVRETLARYVGNRNPPTSTVVFVKKLVRPEWLIEIDAVAVVNN